MSCVRKLCMLSVALCSIAVLQAGDMWDAARAVSEQASASAVRVRVISEMKMDMRGQNVEREQKSEISGTVIEPSGLTIVSATALNPASLISRMLRGMKVEMTIKETMLILADGTEVPAEVVLKDTDLDIAFIRPKEAGKTYEMASLKPRETQPKVLDDVFVVGRLGKNADRAHFVDAGKIRSYVKGPRPYYICTREVSENTGCVVYTADGKPLGVVLAKKSPSEESGQDGMSIMIGGGAGDLAVVRPVEDLLDAVKQALEVKKQEPAK